MTSPTFSVSDSVYCSTVLLDVLNIYPRQWWRSRKTSGPELQVGLKGDEIHPQGINIWSVSNILTQNFIFHHYNDANPRSHYACFYTKT